MYKTVLLMSLLVFYGCRQEKVERYPLDSLFNTAKLISTDSVTKVDICKHVPSDWDSILIVKPYTVISTQEDLRELTNFSNIESDINDIEYSDMICYLLFVKSKKVIGYGEVTRTPFDFAASFPPVGKKLGVIKRSDCEKLYIKRGRRKLFIMP